MEAKNQALLAAAVAGLMTAVGIAGLGQLASAAESGKAPCYGINKCKGTGACSGPGHSCAGKNDCAGHGYLTLEKETCLKIKDGRLTATKS